LKYALVVGDGMSDRPVPELEGKTPLEAAKKPNMDWLASKGQVGMVRSCPEGYTPGTEICMMSLMGYDPKKYFPGRGPLEALGRGLKLKKTEVAFRCNLVTVKGNDLADYSAGHITDEEARELIKMLDKRLGGEEIAFHAGVSYRHLMVWKQGQQEVKSTAPHDIVGQPFVEHLPKGKGEAKLKQLIEDSRLLLEGHEINRARRAKGLNPANMIWLWSPGRLPTVPTFMDKFGVSGSVISAVDVVRGIGVLAGLGIVKVQGATGYFDTNYQGKGEAAVKALKTGDIVFVHVEAPDEAGHQGLVGEKIKAIELMDEHILGRILAARPKLGEMNILVLPDHPTPLSVRTHVADPVPFVLYRDGKRGSGTASFSEESAQASSLYIEDGWRLIERFLGKGKGGSPETQVVN
jgi:2,3-bisphosphoglycerate-independent phosphoglycerate mutase